MAEAYRKRKLYRPAPPYDFPDTYDGTEKQMCDALNQYESSMKICDVVVRKQCNEMCFAKVGDGDFRTTKLHVKDPPTATQTFTSTLPSKRTMDNQSGTALSPVPSKRTMDTQGETVLSPVTDHSVPHKASSGSWCHPQFNCPDDKNGNPVKYI